MSAACNGFSARSKGETADLAKVDAGTEGKLDAEAETEVGADISI
jgi:hypothetical protein